MPEKKVKQILVTRRFNAALKAAQLYAKEAGEPVEEMSESAQEFAKDNILKLANNRAFGTEVISRREAVDALIQLHMNGALDLSAKKISPQHYIQAVKKDVAAQHEIEDRAWVERIGAKPHPDYGQSGIREFFTSIHRRGFGDIGH